jgi:DNA-dependent RNA polymerase auxiliary subunit epsilon
MSEYLILRTREEKKKLQAKAFEAIRNLKQSINELEYAIETIPIIDVNTMDLDKNIRDFEIIQDKINSLNALSNVVFTMGNGMHDYLNDIDKEEEE